MQNMETVTTLSDLLKLAGIKEYKPQSGKQNNKLNKHLKKRKSINKIATAAKPRNPPADFFSKESKQKQNLKSKKIKLENAIDSSPDSCYNLKNYKNNINKSAQETLYVSLDFIKDCQKYKKKYINPKEDLRSDNKEKKQDTVSTDRRGSHVKRKESKCLINENIPSVVPKQEKEPKNSSKDVTKFEKLDTNKIVDKLNKPVEDKTFTKRSQKAESPLNKPFLSDFAKIDKRYLESIISLATNPETRKKNNLEKGEIGKERFKKSTGKTFCKTNTKNKELKMGDSKNEDKIELTESSRMESSDDKTSARILRDSTKSEVRIQLRGKKNFGNLRNSEEFKMEKELPHSKSELIDVRKKRKPRKKIINSNNKEKFEISFSNEISKAKDLKELWRRENQNKSENSLTSHSSCTIPENDENPKWKCFALQSYRILHKLVEEEINKISKNSENKNITKEVKNIEDNSQKVHENKVGSLKENLKPKNFVNKLKLPTDKNLTEEEVVLKKKKLKQAENLQNNTNYEGEKNKSELLNTAHHDSVKTLTRELKLSEETGKTSHKKSPEQTIENWSILNRLEQAFLALGSSNFKDENALETKKDSKSNSIQNCEFLEKPKILKNADEQKKITSKNHTALDTLSNRTTVRSPPNTKIDNNESVSSKKKTKHLKFTFKIRSSDQSNEENQQNELYKTEISTNLYQKGTAKETLVRKKTFNIIPLKGASVTYSQNSNISTKTENNLKSNQEKPRLTLLLTKQESKNNEEKIVRKKPLSRSKSNEKKEEKTRVTPLKNQIRPPSNEKASQENYKSGIPKPKINIKQKLKLVEELIQQEVSKKKILNQKISGERLVKERSILSVHENQQDGRGSKEKIHSIKSKAFSNLPTALKSSTGFLIMKNAEKNYDNTYHKSRSKDKNDNLNIYSIKEGAYEEPDSKQENITKTHSQAKIITSSKQNLLGNKCVLPYASSLSQTQFWSRNSLPEKHSEEIENLKNLSLWERDIRRYREIVKDIMGQYKRIDGFLKQSESLKISSSRSDYYMPSKMHSDSKESSKVFNESRAINIQEYRKKIITEYQTLPFFEYKQLKKDEDNKMEGTRKRNLSVVSDIRKEMDFDIKDYQPKIKKVLNSQLYVDKENLVIQKNPEEKFKNKKFSLQEMVVNRDKVTRKNHCLKSYSLPKTFLPPGNEIYSVHSDFQRHKY